MKQAFVFTLFLCSLSAQPIAQAPATASETAFIQNILITIASPTHDPKLLAIHKSDVATLYGLTEQELAVLSTAGQSYAAALQAFQAQRAAASGTMQLSAASSQMAQKIAAIANQVFQGVRPQTAVLMKTYAAAAASVVPSAKGGN
jgi:hypothetical protein